MATTASSHSLISTALELKAFLSSIPPSSTRYIDLEGNSLSRHGTISLITILIHPQRVVRPGHKPYDRFWMFLLGHVERSLLTISILFLSGSCSGSNLLAGCVDCGVHRSEKRQIVMLLSRTAQYLCWQPREQNLSITRVMGTGQLLPRGKLLPIRFDLRYTTNRNRAQTRPSHIVVVPIVTFVKAGLARISYTPTILVTISLEAENRADCEVLFA